MTAKASEGAVRAAREIWLIPANSEETIYDWIRKATDLIDTLAVQPEVDRSLEEAAKIAEGYVGCEMIAAAIRSLKGGK